MKYYMIVSILSGNTSKQISRTYACILKAYSYSHSKSGTSFSISVDQQSVRVYSLSTSEKRHRPLDHLLTPLTLEIEVEFEWSMSGGYTCLEPHSREVVMNSMANVRLNRLEKCSMFFSIIGISIEFTILSIKCMMRRNFEADLD